MKKQRFIALALAAGMVLSATACSTPASTPSPSSPSSPSAPATAAPAPAAAGKTSIRFFHRWPMEPRNAYFNWIKESFEQQNPDFTLDMDCIVNDAYKEKIRVLVSSSDIPDIFTSWSDTFALNLVGSGKVKELNYLYDGDKDWASKIISSQVKNFTFDDKIYGVPLTIDGKVFAYNKDAFDKYGFDKPATYSELIKILDGLKDDFDGAPLIEGLAATWAISHYQGTIFQRVLDPAVIEKDYQEATGEFTDPGYLKSLDMFEELVSYMGPNATSIDHTEARNAFIAGDHAMIYVQFSELFWFNDAGMNFDFFNFPAVEGGKGDQKQLTGAPEGFMLSNVSTGKTSEGAEKLLKYIVSEEQAKKFVKDCGSPVAIEGAVNKDTSFDAMIGAVDLIKAASGSWPWFDNAVNINIADAFMKGSQAVAAKSTTNAEVMKNVQEEASAVRANAK